VTRPRPTARAVVFLYAALSARAHVASAVRTIETIAGSGSGEGLPALNQAIEPSEVRHDAGGNRFILDTAAVPTRVRCHLRGRGGGTLDLRQETAPGLFDLRGFLRSPVLRVPDETALHVAFTLNDPGRLDYGALAPGCTVTQAPQKMLTCSDTP
jgi:hypothetical protein